MTLKKSFIMIFFILLTLSIGLVSVNLPLSSYAQDNVLGQDGNGLAEQGTEQLQSSEQDGQVVSGDSSIASGNNILCEAMDNSNSLTGLNDFCEISLPDNPPSQGDTARIFIQVVATIPATAVEPGKSLGNYGKLTLDAGQQHYVELLNHSAGDRLSTEFNFRYDIPASGGKFMIDVKPTLDRLKLVQFTIIKNDFEAAADCSGHSVRSPSATCTISNPNLQAPTYFRIDIVYFP